MIDLPTLRREQLRGTYALRQLGNPKFQKLTIHSPEYPHLLGWTISELFDVIIARTEYLNAIIPCEESRNAISHIEAAKLLWPTTERPHRILTTVVPGHIYQVRSPLRDHLTERLRFVRRSSNAIQYRNDWPGLQTQELLRAVIAHLMLHRDHWPLADLCRKALWEYEARAYRRKRQEYNRKDGVHTDTVFPYPWEDIEHQLIGDDGHIPYLESEILYYAMYGACDVEAIPGIDPFQMEIDPVYRATR